MAVYIDSVQLIHNPSSGEVDRDGDVSYMAIWRLQNDTPHDLAQNVVIWWQENKVALGDEYLLANDSFGSLATCKKIAANPVPNTTDWWTVTCTYTREDDDAKRTVDDRPEPIDPLSYRPMIRASSSAVSKPAKNLRYLGGYSRRISAKIVGVPMIPVASNMKPFDPIPDIDSYHWWVSVEQNLEFFDGNVSYVGFLNGETFTISYKGFTRGPIEPGQARIRDCETEFTRERTIDFWKTRYYIEILPDGEYFYHEYPDIGMDSIACGVADDGEPDPDLHGGTFGQGAADTPVLDGRSPAVAMVDPHGMPIRSPVLLDGDGHALDICSEPITPVTSTWWEGKEVTFSEVPVIKEVLA